MSFVPFMDEATVLVKSLCDICLAGAFIGCILMLLESAFVLGFGRPRLAANSTEPAVTVLKPLHGAEPELPARLAAYCKQDYDGPVQVLCGARDANAPAASAVRTMQREHPDWPIEIHADPRRHGSNRKMSNLINMFPRVRHDTLMLSDSDIVVEPSYLRDIAALLAQPRAGAVTALYHGIAGEGLWARLSALAINMNFLPQAITGLALKAARPCFGATVALRRSVLEEIGGFSRFADELADDYAIGMAVRSADYDVVIAPFLVGHVCFETSLRQFVRHQIGGPHRQDHRSDRHAVTIVTTLAAGAAWMPGAAPRRHCWRLPPWHRALHCADASSGVSDCRGKNIWLIPLQDIVAFAVYVASYFGTMVHSRGAEYRVATDGHTLIRGRSEAPMMRTLCLQAPSFDGFDGGKYSGRALSGAARSSPRSGIRLGLLRSPRSVPGSKLVHRRLHQTGTTLKDIVTKARDYDLAVLHTSTPSFSSDVQRGSKRLNPPTRLLKAGLLGRQGRG